MFLLSISMQWFLLILLLANLKFDIYKSWVANSFSFVLFFLFINSSRSNTPQLQPPLPPVPPNPTDRPLPQIHCSSPSSSPPPPHYIHCSSQSSSLPPQDPLLPQFTSEKSLFLGISTEHGTTRCNKSRHKSSCAQLCFHTFWKFCWPAAPLPSPYFLLWNLIANVLNINPGSTVLKTLHRFSIVGLVLSFT